MTKHPLTDEKTEELELIPPEVMEKPEDYASYLRGTPVSDAIRLAKDWQLEQVMNWLDKHLINYSDDDYQSSSFGDCEPLDKLEGDLKKAMRPTQDNS